MTFDSARGRVVLFGGMESPRSPFADAWEWDGTSWTERQITVMPRARSRHAMAFDPARGVATIFAGASEYSYPYYLSDTWHYAPVYGGAYDLFGAGCSGSAGTPVLDAAWNQRPWIGCQFTVALRDLPPGRSALVWLGRSDRSFGAVSLPLDLASIGMPGCTLFVSTEAFVAVFNLTGAASASIIVPDDPTLIGGKFYNQAFVVDPGSNPFGATMSNAAAGTIGSR
jgi:hypothetical protein